MKKNIIFLFILLSAFIVNFNPVLSAGFNSINSPDGTNVIAVGDGGLIFRSVNAGNTWASYTMPSVNFKNVCSYGENVWIAGDNGKIYKTKKINSEISDYDIGVTTSINAITFVDDNNGFLCGDAGIIYKTLDGGLTWTPCNTGILNEKLNSLSFINLNDGIVVGNNGTAYVTHNGGTSWTPESPGSTKNFLKVKYFSDGFVIAGEYGTLLIKQGASAWTSVNTRIVTDVRSVTGSGMNDIHICGGGGFIRNNKGGDARFYQFEANPMMANLVDITYFDSNLGFAVSSLNNAIIKTTNAGVTWALSGGSTMSYQWQSKLSAGSGIGNNLCAHPTDRNSVFCGYGNKVYVSRNRGDNWTQIASNLPGNALHSFYVSPLDTNIWVGAIESSPDKVIRTTNYGVTWTVSMSANFSNYGQPLEMDQNDPHVFYYAPDNGGFYKSTDIGATFTQISAYPFRSPCDIIVMWDSANVIFVGDGVTGSGQAIIYKSVNTGVNWTAVKTVAASESPSMSNSVFKQDEVYATEWSGSNWYESEDYGDTWTIQHNTGFSGWGSGICFEDPNTVLIGNYGSSSAFTWDGGNTYSTVNGLSGAGAGILLPDKNMILNMQTGGIYKFKVNYATLTTVNENIYTSAIPNSYNLYQNYPNPFNPTTNIKFDLPNSGNISLKVYNQLGKEVQTLSEGFKSAGSYEINFDASGLSSGVYFYKLVTGTATMTKKMLLVK